MQYLTTKDAEKIAGAFQASIVGYVHLGRNVFALKLQKDHTKDDLVNAGVELVNIFGYTCARNFGWNMKIASDVIFFPE